MKSAYAIIIAVVLMALGVPILLDYRHMTSTFRSWTEAWWNGGPVRRRSNVKVPSFRFMGALVMLMGVIVLLSVIFGSSH
jgi:hypothetical protein